MRLLYIADPLCSWCYGFGPELGKLLARRPETELGVMMGGLRPYNTDVMTPAFREMLRGHWRHVHEASGLPFSEALLARDDFVYDTEPACRAVVTARAIDAVRALPYLEAVQAAFYRDGRDMTLPGGLAEVAADCGFERGAFLASMESGEMREATRGDFMDCQALGVAGFPTLACLHAEQAYLVTSGFATADVLEARVDQISLRLAAC